MLLELYLTFVRLALEYGNYQAMLIIAFLCSIVVFVAALVAKLILKNFKPWWFAAFLVNEIYFLLAQLFLAFWYGVDIPLLLFFEPSVYVFLLFVVPMTLVYRKIMAQWSVLPWHLVIFSLSLLASVVFWYFLVFVYGVLVLV